MTSTRPSKLLGSAQEDLLELMARLWNTKEKSDLTIICGSEIFEVHSWVLCLRSKFFEIACHGDFKEATTKRIELQDDKPAMVVRMLQYCYGMTYDSGDHEVKEPPWISSIHTNAQMLALADKYDMEGLKENVYGRLVFNMKAWMQSDSKLASIHTLISLVYDHTRATDCELRDLFGSYTHKNWQRLRLTDPNIKIALAENPDFVLDVISSKPPFIKEPEEKPHLPPHMRH